MLQQVPAVDCTETVIAVHQNHGYGYHPSGKHGTNVDPLAKRNYVLGGKWNRLRCIVDCRYRLTRQGEIRYRPITGRLIRDIKYFSWKFREFMQWGLPDVLRYKVWLPVWHFALDVTRPVRSPLGLRSQAVREKGKR
jgi:hypothetical protein